MKMVKGFGKTVWYGAKRTVLLFLALLTVFSVLSPAVHALETDSLRELKAETGTVVENGGSYALIYNEQTASGTAAAIRSYPVPLDLYYADVLEMEFTVFTDSPSSPKRATVSATLYFTDGVIAEFSAESGGDGLGRLIMPLEGVTGTMQLSDVRIAAELPEGGAVRILPITVEKETSASFAKRFLCREFSAYRGSVSLASDGSSLQMNFYGSAGYVEGEVAEKLENTGVNALRLTLLSSSRSMSLTVYYSYGDGVYSEENCVSVDIERSDEPAAYLIPLPEADRVKRLRIMPEATGLTNLTVSSLLAVSAYADGTEYLGEVEKCVLSADGNSVTLRGKIPTPTVALHRDSLIAVYAVNGEGRLSDAPIKTAPISARFEVNAPAAEGDIGKTKYYLCLVTETGEIYPVAPAKYAEPYGATKAEPLPFKGLLGDGCTDIGEGSAIAEVDLSLLFDPKGSGYAYRFEGEYYFFTREEVDRLKTEILHLDAVGCKIILRLTCSNPGREVPFTFSHNESGVFGYGLNATTDEGRRYIRAAISFLSSAVAGSDYTIYGYVVGKNIESGGEYNFMAADLPLDDYAKNYLHALRTVYAAARQANSAARVFVGLGDEWENSSLGRKFLFPDYDAFMLLEALAGRASAEGGVEFTVLTETSKTPDPSANKSVFGGDEVRLFLKKLSERYGIISPHPVFLWTPAGGSACGAYAYLYYSALFDGVECFFLDLASVGRLTDTGELVRLATSIDTVKTLVNSAPYLARYGIRAEDMEGYRPEMLVMRELKNGELTLTSPITALGSVTFRDYTKKSAAPDLIRCTSCAVYGYGLPYALCEFFDRTEGDCAAVIDLEGTEELSLADTVYFDIAIESETVQTVTVSVCGGGTEREFVATLPPGTYRLYTSEAIPEGEGDYIRIALSGNGKLYLYGIGGESATKFDNRLSALLHEARGADRPVDDNAERNWGIIVCIGIFISSATAVMMRRSAAQVEENGKNGEEKEEEWKF